MVKEQNQNVDKYDIPVWRKYTLSVQEAQNIFTSEIKSCEG